MAVDADVLLDWFSTHGRDLPWREPDCSAWGVLVSEIMLQQTPVVRVQPIWHEWMARWPVPSALAASSQGEVVRAWGKLGYPRRALRLHEAAGVIAREHGDVVPSDVDTLLALPGIGAYTARAVAAFAYGRRAPVVDTNVRRVVARAVHGAGDAGPASNTRDMNDVEVLLPAEDAPAAKFSAAIMELGALICTARAPKCADCPIYDECAWQLAGRPEYAGPAKPVQKFAGTDRQVRGRLLDVLRGSEGPVEKAKLDLVWHEAGQRDRCLDSLLVDGLLEQTRDGLFALPGEH
ncbi:A/G-specific adenine glycosylase [Amycolatopsis sp. SID8362]|uniref:A/G-specific adenine glycosylase n=1 Tax=Amycolatopsis sp. SID8362 TaxID=2690346 RepID=UPI0013690C07|nr:A/G-specific adenine glycosylase [Amycolatopsis sp. SID8362]NBH01995.1 A/G-specific adenine glycosylase [Amycolatopsis sp. SID8362]NED38698.1 A/G-specific adenine glycosylase [Amycolatopsis sp. SID8362]